MHMIKIKCITGKDRSKEQRLPKFKLSIKTRKLPNPATRNQLLESPRDLEQSLSACCSLAVIFSVLSLCFLITPLLLCHLINFFNSLNKLISPCKYLVQTEATRIISISEGKIDVI